jgi:hypothetical protein
MGCKACPAPLYEVSFVLRAAHYFGLPMLGSDTQKPNAEEAFDGEPYATTRRIARRKYGHRIPQKECAEGWFRVYVLLVLYSGPQSRSLGLQEDFQRI